MSWDDLRVFLAVARMGSHARAARGLGLDPTTVGRRLAALEEAIGASLFDRTPGGLRLTEAGTALRSRAERAEEEITAAERELRGADASLSGSIRLTAGDGVTHYRLIPALAALRRAHPDLSVELRADTRVLDLSRREADVAVRLSRPKETTLVARRLGTMRFGLFASAVYLERRGAPRRVDDLAGHDWVGFDADFDDLAQVRWLGRTVPGLRYVLRANATTAQVVACAEGHGIGLLPAFVSEREPRLVPLLPRLAGPTREMWGVTHEAMRRNARVALVMQWLARTLAD